MAGFGADELKKEHVMENLTHHREKFGHCSAHGVFSSSTQARRLHALLLVTTLLAATAAACAPIPQTGPIDVGSMAYPDPLLQGNLATVTLSGRQTRDTGSMAYPDALPQGNVGTTVLPGRRPRGTGNMAYPDPQPVGNIGTTTVR